MGGIRYGLVYLALAAPWIVIPALLGAAAFGPVGALIGASLVLLAVVYAAFFAEAMLRKRLHVAVGSHPEGLAWTVARVAEAIASDCRPDVVAISADNAPWAIAGRSWAGSGVVVLSRGLMEMLTEADLRAVLGRGIRFLDDPALRLATVAALLGGLPFVGRFREVTRGLIGQEDGSERKPILFTDMMALLLIAPWSRYWNLMARRFTASFQLSLESDGAADAARKVEIGLRTWNPRGRPEWAPLAVLGRLPSDPLEGILGRGYP